MSDVIPIDECRSIADTYFMSVPAARLSVAAPIVPRSRETIVELLDGFGIWRAPGLINVAEWPTNDPFPPQVERAQLVGGILDVRAPSAIA